MPPSVCARCAGCASESELDTFYALQRANAFPCSFACEVEFHANDRRADEAALPPGGTLRGGVHIVCQAVSHSTGGKDGERENSMKRAATNAYLSLFQHMAILRSAEGSCYIRAFD